MASLDLQVLQYKNPKDLQLEDEKQREMLNRLKSQYKNDFCECLTYNVAGLPPNIMDNLECTGANMQSAQELRIRGFVGYLDRLIAGMHTRDNCHTDPKEKIRPAILAFQEVIWKPLRIQLHESLVARKYTTHKNISLLNRQDQPPILYDGGVALYVDAKRFKMLDSELHVFQDRCGLDMFCEKGFLVCLIECIATKKVFMAINLHPQAYTDLNVILDSVANNEDSKSLMTEKQDDSMLQLLLANGKQTRAELIAMIRHFQQKQFEQIRDTVAAKIFSYTKKGFNLKGLFYFGDFNVNRWNVEPMSAEERDPIIALGGGQLSNDIVKIMNILKCRQPPIIRSPQCSTDTRTETRFKDLYTWNGKMNVMAAEKNPDQPVYQWLDYIMYSTDKRIPLPKYMDNHVEPIVLEPFPDLSSFWSPSCHSLFEKNETTKEVNAEATLAMGGAGDGSTSSSSSSQSFSSSDPTITTTTTTATPTKVFSQKNKTAEVVEKRLELGRWQSKKLLTRFQEKLKARGYPLWNKIESAVDPPTAASVASPIIQAWVHFVRTAPFWASSQVWKGFHFYGFKPTDHLTLMQRKLIPPYVGHEHGFANLHHGSDHSAVSTRFVLPK